MLYRSVMDELLSRPQRRSDSTETVTEIVEREDVQSSSRSTLQAASPLQEIEGMLAPEDSCEDPFADPSESSVEEEVVDFWLPQWDMDGASAAVETPPVSPHTSYVSRTGAEHWADIALEDPCPRLRLSTLMACWFGDCFGFA